METTTKNTTAAQAAAVVTRPTTNVHQRIAAKAEAEASYRKMLEFMYTSRPRFVYFSLLTEAQQLFNLGRMAEYSQYHTRFTPVTIRAAVAHSRTF